MRAGPGRLPANGAHGVTRPTLRPIPIVRIAARHQGRTEDAGSIRHSSASAWNFSHRALLALVTQHRLLQQARRAAWSLALGRQEIPPADDALAQPRQRGAMLRQWRAGPSSSRFSGRLSRRLPLRWCTCSPEMSPSPRKCQATTRCSQRLAPIPRGAESNADVAARHSRPRESRHWGLEGRNFRRRCPFAGL